jgi:hypothetical protein
MMLHDVRRVEVLEAHRLRLGFDDGAEGDVDIASLVPFEGVFGPLHESGYFARVRVDPELGTIRWPNGADIDPEVLYSAATGARLPEWAPPQSASRAPDPPAPGMEASMPEICWFFGIVIQMYFREHPVAHFHVRYGVAIDSVSVLGGEIPPRVVGLVAEWATLHRDELRDNWERARRGLPLEKIAPLE